MTKRERKPTPPDPASCTSGEAARILGVGYNTFNSWWDHTNRGWDIPVGNTTTFVPSIGHSDRKRRVPRARVTELAGYGKTEVAS